MDSEKLVREFAKFVLGQAVVSATTAPKTRGMETIWVCALDRDEAKELGEFMVELGKKVEKGGHRFIRDGECLKKAEGAILVGAKKLFLGLDCGFCGAKSCADARDRGISCCYPIIDLGIAVGSCVASLADMRVDNRVMYTVGYAAKLKGIVPEDIGAVVGIPIAIATKNPFFDRK